MVMTIRLDDDEERRLAQLATSLGVSKSDVLRQAVTEKYEREEHRARVREAGDFVKRRDANLLRRLGDA